MTTVVKWAAGTLLTLVLGLALLNERSIDIVTIFRNGKSTNFTDSAGKMKRIRSGYNNHAPEFVFGISTGHAGSGTSQVALITARCPWMVSGVFEYEAPGQEESTSSLMGANQTGSCRFALSKLIPLLESNRREGFLSTKKLNVTRQNVSLAHPEGAKSVWIDMGHFQNRLPLGLDCMAEHSGSRAAFVRIRRDRYAIANSFAKKTETPCFHEAGKKHPRRSYCPYGEDVKRDHGETSLPVRDEVWEQLGSFQKFLWLADEIELRYQALRRDFPDPLYLELSWSTSGELAKGLHLLRRRLGCVSEDREVSNQNTHVEKSFGTENCTRRIAQDIRYRELVGLTNQQKTLIFQSQKQRVGGPECMESLEDLRRVLLSFGEQLEEWELV